MGRARCDGRFEAGARPRGGGVRPDVKQMEAADRRWRHPEGRTLLLPAVGLRAPDYLDLGYDIVSTGTSTTTGTGGTGGGLVCTPGATQECYSGPAGTKDQGICKPGQQTCSVDGSAFGPCEGQVLPTQEDCASPQDEDCNGLAPPCKGQFLWAKRFGDPQAGFLLRCRERVGSSWPAEHRIDRRFNAPSTSGWPLTTAGANDVFWAVLDGDGGYVRAARFGDQDGQAATGTLSSQNRLDPGGGVFWRARLREGGAGPAISFWLV